MQALLRFQPESNATDSKDIIAATAHAPIMCKLYPSLTRGILSTFPLQDPLKHITFYKIPKPDESIVVMIFFSWETLNYD